MRDTDLQGATALSTEVGWPYRSEDWRFALALGRGILAECDERVVASALWWPFGDRFATCGMIIVSPSMQRRGLGRALMTNLLHDVGERTLLLNSTEEGLLLYRTFGFQDIGTVHQHQAWTSADMAIPCADAGHVRATVPDDLHAIVELDRDAAGFSRRPLLAALHDSGVTAVIERDRSIHGFAICRRFGLGHSIGPVVAKSINEAKLLIRHFMQRQAGGFVRIDTSGDSRLSAWLASVGLPEVGSVTTMVRGQRPEPASGTRLFALASQSLG